MAQEEMRTGTGHARPVQKRQVTSGGWGKARRAKFLKALGETCNVSKAARAAGLESASHIYTLRRRDPAFADLWAEALANGYDRLETMLLRRALEGVNDIDVAALAAESDREAAADDGNTANVNDRRDPGTVLPPAGLARADVQLALAMLNRRREGDMRQRRGKPPMTSDEVDALLGQKLDSLARKLRPLR